MLTFHSKHKSYCVFSSSQEKEEWSIHSEDKEAICILQEAEGVYCCTWVCCPRKVESGLLNEFQEREIFLQREGERSGVTNENMLQRLKWKVFESQAGKSKEVKHSFSTQTVSESKPSLSVRDRNLHIDDHCPL